MLPSSTSNGNSSTGQQDEANNNQQQGKLKKVVKSVIPKLQNCTVNLSLFRKVAADELREMIDSVVGFFIVMKF